MHVPMWTQSSAASLTRSRLQAMHVQPTHIQAPCADPKQCVAHPTHIAYNTWLSWSLVERQNNNWEDIMPGEQPLISPQGKSKKAYIAL